MQKDNGLFTVSVIIPVYNAEKYLKECVDSVLGQTYEKLEIIFVDDGSTDSSTDLIEDYRKKDSRIKLLRQEHQFAGVARNRGISEAKGDYLIFLDADDRFSPVFIETMVKCAQRYDADIVNCDSVGFDSELNIRLNLGMAAFKTYMLPDRQCFSAADIPDHILRFSGGWSWDKLYRTQFVRDNDLKFLPIRVAEDSFFVFLAFAVAQRVSIVEDRLVEHRMYDRESTWKTRNRSWKDPVTMCLRLREELIKRGLYETLKIGFINMASEYIFYGFLGMGDKNSSDSYSGFWREHAASELDFDSFDEDIFDDRLAYRFLKRMETVDNSELLPELLHTLAEEKDRAVFYFTDQIREMGQHVHLLEKYTDILEKKKHWRLDEPQNYKGKKIILYGYGDVGKDYYRQLSETEGIKIAGVADASASAAEMLSERIKIEDIAKAEYDLVIIALAKEEIFLKVREMLIKLGVPEEKIFWPNPMGTGLEEG